MRLSHLCLLNVPKIEDNRLVRISMQNYCMSSSFQYLKWGLEDLIDRVWYQAEFRISTMSQYVRLGHGLQEYRGAIVTRSHKKRSEQSVVTGIDFSGVLARLQQVR